MRDEDIAYYEKRVLQERAAADSCADNTIALAHRRMADEYEKRLLGRPFRTYLI